MHGSLFIPTRGVHLLPTGGFRWIPTSGFLENFIRGGQGCPIYEVMQRGYSIRESNEKAST